MIAWIKIIMKLGPFIYNPNPCLWGLCQRMMWGEQTLVFVFMLVFHWTKSCISRRSELSNNWFVTSLISFWMNTTNPAKITIHSCTTLIGPKYDYFLQFSKTQKALLDKALTNRFLNSQCIFVNMLNLQYLFKVDLHAYVGFKKLMYFYICMKQHTSDNIFSPGGWLQHKVL